MSKKIKFDWELYKANPHKYKVFVSFQNYEVTQLTLFENVDTLFCIYGVMNGDVSYWTINGVDMDFIYYNLFLVEVVEDKPTIESELISSMNSLLSEILKNQDVIDKKIQKLEARL